MRIVCCLVCETTYDEGDQCAIESKHSGALYGVCPTCRKHAEIGKRIVCETCKHGTRPGAAGVTESCWVRGYHPDMSCWEAKGEKP